MKRLFLLDAYALIYRAYYALLSAMRTNSKGQNTGAILGFVNTLSDVLNSEEISHIAVVFDPPGGTFRHELSADYKANREATPEDIRFAVPIIKEILKAWNIEVVEVPGFEADDVIGTLAKKAEEKDFEVFMLTPDKDYAQLVTAKSKLYRPRRGGGFEILGEREVCEKFAIAEPKQMIDLLGLMGDSADNIPGCPGVGEKTAAKLLAQFSSIENLLENTAKIKGSLREKVEQNKEQILFSRFLATIKTDVEIEFSQEKFEKKEPNKEELLKIFTELEFRSLVAKLTGEKGGNSLQGTLFGGESAAEILPANNFETISTTAHSYRIMQSAAEISELVAILKSSAEFCFDTETDSLNVFSASLVGMSFAVAEFQAFYVPVPKEKSSTLGLLENFREVFENEKIGKIGHNLKFDLLMLKNYGVEIGGKLFDTMVAHYLLNPELRHSMDYLAETLLNYQTVHIEELIGVKGKNQISMRDVALEKIADYAAEDADVTLRLKNLLSTKIAENGLEKLFYEIEMPLVRVLVEMENNGVLIDDFALAQSSAYLTREMQNLETEIRQTAGGNINVSSPKQIGELLFEKLKISEKPKKTKTGQFITDEETLESLRSKHEVVGKILDYRGLKKLLGTYIDALPGLIEPRTGKIHTSFNQTVTTTGRLSSSNPNLQNIPIRTEQGKTIRTAFIAGKGCQFLSADYSQVELRIMAHLSGDENMIEAFLSDKDIHSATAAKIYKVPIEQVTDEMRRGAKTANFGIIYGISAFGLAERLGISRTEAKELIDGYFLSFPKVKTYMEQSIISARENGFVETILKRKRFLADINSRNANVRAFAERNAINAPIQGSAADIIKIAMVRIFERMKKENMRSQMILQVHDELNFNVLENEIEIMKTLVREEMEDALELCVPLKVDIGVGKNWLEAH